MICTKKHIDLDSIIPDKDFICPKCGANIDEGFVIDANLDSDCDLYHSDDYCLCESCGGGWKLSTIIKKYNKKKNLIECPYCKGSGYISQILSNGKI